MIKASRSRYGVWLDLDHGASANVEVHHYGIKLRISDDNYAAEVSHADAVSLLRAMLREITGPSIDDVRDVWGDQRIWVRWWPDPPTDMSGRSRDVCEIVDRLGRGILDGRQRFATEREALQAAYDAGVARMGGDGA